MFNRTTLWMIYNDIPVAIEAFSTATDDERRGQVFLVLLPPGGENARHILFESELEGRGLYKTEAVAVGVAHKQAVWQITHMHDVLDILKNEG